MDNEYYNYFVSTAENIIESGTAPNSFKVRECAGSPVSDSSAARFHSSHLNSINNLDEELKRFESLFSNGNNSVFWASDYNDVFESLRKLFKLYKVKSVRLPSVKSSTIFREIGIKDFLSDCKIELAEDGAMQFFAADMFFSDTSSILLLNQTNTTFSRLSNSKINVFFTTVDKIVSSSSWAETIQQLSSYSNNCGRQDMVIFHSSPNCKSYLFVIDNQRSCVLSNKSLRPALSCIGCGRCSDVCPVFQTIGETPYNNVFSGPVANITLPYLETFESYMHVAYACTLCGRCEEVCPLSLPIRDMVVESRRTILSEGVLPRRQRRALSLLHKYLTNRSKLNRSAFFKRHLLLFFLSPALRHSRRIPSFSPETLNKSLRKPHV